MFCIKCGTKNEDDSRFCINCGEELADTVEEKKEEVKEEVKEETKNPVEEVMNKRKKLIEEKNDAKSDDTTGIKIDGKKVETVTTTNNSNNGGNSKAVIIIVIVVGVILLLGLLGFAAYSIYNQFVADNPITSKKPTKPTAPTTKVDGWEISYTIPEGFEEEEYNTETLKIYKYNKDGIMCSANIWEVSYIRDGFTEEDVMQEYSVNGSGTLNISNVKINGKEWKYAKTDRTYVVSYEYGRFNSKKDKMYYITYNDYDPDKPTCKQKLDELMKSIKY